MDWWLAIILGCLVWLVMLVIDVYAHGSAPLIDVGRFLVIPLHLLAIWRWGVIAIVVFDVLVITWAFVDARSFRAAVARARATSDEEASS